ncbi:MAG: hypothetical protein HY318_04240 [Armatimonadetes bacterium]|nr:hypothetical protein [Armatimonadota bacterium]
MRRRTKPGSRLWITLALAPVLSTIDTGHAARPWANRLYLLQSNDMDPTTPTSQMDGRWNHWLAVDSVVTHLETGIAVDSAEFAGRGQRIVVKEKSPVTAVQVKMKRIGHPGALRWEVGREWGRADLGRGVVPSSQVNPNYEHFVTLKLKPCRTDTLYLRLTAASGHCPQDYYVVYCTWREPHPEPVEINAYYGRRKLSMLYRMVRPDPNGEALDVKGKPLPEGPSMMTRMLTTEPGPGRRELLPDEEEPYSFVGRLVKGEDPRREGLPWPGVRPEPGEVALKQSWRIEVRARRSPRVETAVRDLESFLRQCMKVPMRVVWRKEERSLHPSPRTITLTESPDLPGGPRRPAGYRFEARKEVVHLHGFDDRGVLRSVWYLEDLLMLRGGPFLRPDVRTREPRFSPRATCAAWGAQGEMATTAPVYTDAHLSLISHYGYDAVWLVWYPGSERIVDERESGRKGAGVGETNLPTKISPGRIPEPTSHTPFTARLNNLIDRAAKYDLDVVVQYSGRHPTNEAEKKLIQNEARRFLRDVPKLKTVILLDEAMGASWIGREAWLQDVDLVSKAMFEERPELQIPVWVYNLNAGGPDHAHVDPLMERFCKLDRRCGFMQTFEAYWSRRRDGTLQPVFDYSLSLKAPSEDFRLEADYLLEEAKRDGKPPRPLWAKTESRFAQESNTQPEIPCMQKWAERFQALGDFNAPPLTAVMGNYFHQGFFPTPVTELFGWLSYTNPPHTEELLRALARRDFGPGQEDLVVSAWQDFTDAIWNYPYYYGLTYTMNTGFAQPFWLDPSAPNPRPWRRGFVNSLQPLNLEDSGSSAGSGGENRARLQELQKQWSAGLGKLRKAVDAAPSSARERAESNWRCAQSFGHKAEVTLRLVRWFDARNRLYNPHDAESATTAAEELEKAGREELGEAKGALPMYQRDSRLGYLNHGRGCFTPDTILWKIGLLERTLNEELPRLREAARNVQAVRGELERATLERDWQVLTAGKARSEWINGSLKLSSPETASGIMLAGRQARKLPLRISFTVSTGVIAGGSTFCIMRVPPKPGLNDDVHRGRLTFLVLKPGEWYYKLNPAQIAASGKWNDPPTLQPGGAPHRFTLSLTRTQAVLSIDDKEVLRGPVNLPEEVYAYLTPDAYTNYDTGMLYLYMMKVEEVP